MKRLNIKIGKRGSSIGIYMIFAFLVIILVSVAMTIVIRYYYTLKISLVKRDLFYISQTNFLLHPLNPSQSFFLFAWMSKTKNYSKIFINAMLGIRPDRTFLEYMIRFAKRSLFSKEGESLPVSSLMNMQRIAGIKNYLRCLQKYQKHVIVQNCL